MASTTDNQYKPADAAQPASLEDLLRDGIRSQSIPPGSKLNEIDLAAEYGVSRAQVRDTIASLAQRGLIEKTPNRGAIVRRLEPARVTEIFAVREVLEGLAARLAAERSQPGEWDLDAQALNHRMPEALAAGDFEAFLANYEDFRRHILRVAANAELDAMLESIAEKISILSHRIVILPGRGEQALAEHKAVLEALQRGDGPQAEARRKVTMRNGLEWFNRFQRFIL